MSPEIPEVVWSVIYMIGIGLVGTGYGIYYIMRTAYIEMHDGERQNFERSKV
mgnify:CR=1 FL=1